MIFVIGPLFSGKQDYIMQALGWSETDFLEKAVRDVQDLAAEAAEAVEASHSPLDDLQEKLRSLADRLSQKEVVIATETGGGVIPLDPQERRNREAAGRLSCLLAERAETVVRVCCGIPQVLKGSGFETRNQIFETFAEKERRGPSKKLC